MAAKVAVPPGLPGPDWPERSAPRPAARGAECGDGGGVVGRLQGCATEGGGRGRWSKGGAAPSPAIPARFRAVQDESEGYPKQRAVSCIQSILD